MRTAFIEQLSTLASQDKRLMLLTGDLGFKVFDKFQQQHPNQFKNVGVAESFMVGLAAGMSFEGMIPFCYSIAPFLTMRPFEFIRNDVCFHRANVKLVSVGGGYSYGPNGPTHHALTDLTLMQSFPEMTIFTPADPWEVRFAIEQAVKINGPVYVRLGRAGEEVLHQGKIATAFNKPIELIKGEKVMVVASGLITANAYQAVKQLQHEGISVGLTSVPCIKPLDQQWMLSTFKHFEHIICIDEHDVRGGLSLELITLAQQERCDVRKLLSLGAIHETLHVTGSQEYLRKQSKLDVASIVSAIKLRIK